MSTRNSVIILKHHPKIGGQRLEVLPLLDDTIAQKTQLIGYNMNLLPRSVGVLDCSGLETGTRRLSITVLKLKLIKPELSISHFYAVENQLQ